MCRVVCERPRCCAGMRVLLSVARWSVWMFCGNETGSFQMVVWYIGLSFWIAFFQYIIPPWMRVDNLLDSQHSFE